MQNPYYYGYGYHHPDHYQPTSHPQNRSKQNNNSSHQENFQTIDNMPSTPNELTTRDNNHDHENFGDINNFIPPYSEFHGYHNDHIPYIPYTFESGSDLERRLNHLSYQLAHLIQQNNQLLRYVQKRPEHSHTVSTPTGGTVIVRM